MSDPHSTRERAAWVIARAGRSPAARRRGERLAARARRLERDDAGVGAAPVHAVVSRGRFSRRLNKHEDHRLAWGFAYGLVEAAGIAAVGPGIALGWAGYGLLYRAVPERGPLQWKRLAVFAAVVVPVVLVIALSIGFFGAGLPWEAKYLSLQVIWGAGYLAWLARAQGWEAVTASRETASSGRKVTVKVALPQDVPSQPKRIVVRRKATAAPTAPIADAEVAPKVKVQIQLPADGA